MKRASLFFVAVFFAFSFPCLADLAQDIADAKARLSKVEAEHNAAQDVYDSYKKQYDNAINNLNRTKRLARNDTKQKTEAIKAAQKSVAAARSELSPKKSALDEIKIRVDAAKRNLVRLEASPAAPKNDLKPTCTCKNSDWVVKNGSKIICKKCGKPPL